MPESCPNRTVWFIGFTNGAPRFPGPYEFQVDETSPILYAYWDGHYWRQLRQTPQAAAQPGPTSWVNQLSTFRWRGLNNPFLPF